MNYTNRPIAAYTMAEFESLTSDNADFARSRGSKDKKKRKSRAGLYAGIGAGALALGAPAVRYGGAEVMSRMAGNKMKKSGKARHPELLYGKGYSESGGGAKGALDRDVQAVKDMGDRVKNYDYKGVPGRAFDSMKSAGSSVKNYDYKGIPGKLGNAAKEGFSKAKGFAGTTGGKVGLGLAGAGLVGGAGYGIYKAMKKGKKK
jgi:hypothetical protein